MTVKSTILLILGLSTGLVGSEETVFPPQSGVIDVTQAPYYAVGDGQSDDTPAIQQALNDHANGNRILYLPNGTYRITDTLKWGSGTRGGMAQKRTILQGQSRMGTVITLVDDALGFQDPRQPRAVIWTGRKPAQRFRNAIRNLTVSTGRGNPGAVGIQFNASNQGTLNQVTIVAGDGQGRYGLDFAYTDEVGPLLVRHLTVAGFDIGIRAGHTVNSQTFEHVILTNQLICGLENRGQVVNIRDLRSINRVTALINGSGSSCMTLLDSSLEGQALYAAPAAVENSGTLFARQVKTSGYGTAITNQSGHKQGAALGSVAEFASHPPIQQFDGPVTSLNLPIKDTPEVPWDKVTDWAVVTDFGARGDGRRDDSAALQAAIDSGKPTVCLPGGKTFRVDGTVFLRGKMQRLIGCEGRLNGQGRIVFTDEGSAPVVVFERFSILYAPLEIRHESKRTLILSSAIVAKVTSTGPGDFFIDDVCGGPWRFSNPQQHIWARQLNPENNDVPKITNDGATLWILGLKTEKANICVDTLNGGRTEVLGAHIYAQGGPKTTPMLRIQDASASFACVRETNWSAAKQYTDYVSETFNGVTRVLRKTEAPRGGAGTGRVLPLYVGYGSTD